MMGRRRLALSIGLAVAGPSWWLAAAPSQGAPVSASVVKVGWWSQQPGAQPQPDGGFQVTLGPQGPQSVAALEINVDKGDGVTVALTLTEGQSIAPDRAALQACSTNGGWAAANPGTFTDAPPAGCSRPVALTRDASSTTWKGDITSLAPGGATSDIIIVPVPQPVGGVVDPGYSVTVTKAAVTADATSSTGPDQFGFAPPPTSGDSPGGSGTSSGFNPPAAQPNSGAFTPSTPSGSGSFATAAPVVAPSPAVAGPPLTPDATAAGPGPAPAATPTPFGAGGAKAGKRPGEHRPWGRLIILLPLAVLVGAGATYARRYPIFGATTATP